MATSSRYKYLCGTPKDQCVGGFSAANSGLGKGCKMHATTEEAFNCHASYLLKQGYIQIGSREFQDPKTGFVQVLCKKSKFGARMRPGKSGETSKMGGGRFVPRRATQKGNLSGHVIVI